jgi:hypothetical protein
MRTKKPVFLGLALLFALCAGCAGGGSSTGPTGAAGPAAGTTIAGVASKGIIKGGKVEIFAPTASGDLTGKILLKTTSTDSSGAYSANIGSYSGVVLVEVTGSSVYTDEATGVSSSVPASAPLRAAQVIGTSGGTVTVCVTPLTELATRKALAGSVLVPAAVQAANALVSNLFQFDIVATRPVEPGVTAMNAASQDQRDYTLVLAGVSKLAASAGSVDTVLSGWYNDLAATNRLSAGSVASFQGAVTGFLADTTHNQTGVTALPTGVAQVGNFSGVLYLATQGSSTAPISSIQATVSFPAGVTVQKDAAGLPLVSVSGSAAQAAAPAVNSPTPGSVVLAVISSPGFGLGQFATIRYVAQPGSIPVAADFQVSASKITGFDGTNDFEITTATVVPVLP